MTVIIAADLLGFIGFCSIVTNSMRCSSITIFMTIILRRFMLIMTVGACI